MKNPIVRVEHLSHRYTVQWAIEDINFEIEAGGIVGLLGSNGAGKSTTMNIICGVLNQTHGEVYIDGINLREHPVEAKRNIGFLPQKPPIYPDLNVEEYLRFCADLRFVAKKDIQSAVNRAMARCGITHFKNRLIRNLSGGYQQRVGIAQAIVHDPNFAILYIVFIIPLFIIHEFLYLTILQKRHPKNFSRNEFLPTPNHFSHYISPRL